MDHHIRDFFSQSEDEIPVGKFHTVIPLHETPHLSFEVASRFMPTLCKGWHELACLRRQDRIEFILEYWLKTLPYHPKITDFLTLFFKELDDVGIFLFQKRFDDPFDANIVYSLKQDRGFFRGAVPALERDIIALESAFAKSILPRDYLAFLRIHNGFSKTTDSTGITPSTLMLGQYHKFQESLAQEVEITTTEGLPVNPKSLIPFYESFGMPFFQCFWEEWYPKDEMGNVYYSGVAKTISDINSGGSSSESMAFPTFLDWLMFYMERIE